MSFESGAFAQIMEESVRSSLGYKRVDGLDFWVKDDAQDWWNRQLFERPTRVYDRPFTKADQRRHNRAQRKRRWAWRFKGPYYEAKRRLSHALYALRGNECERW